MRGAVGVVISQVEVIIKMTLNSCTSRELFDMVILFLYVCHILVVIM